MSYTAATDDPDIAHYWMLRHYPRVLRWQQHGGGDRYIHKVRGVHPIEYNVSDDGKTMFIRGGYKPLVAPCFVVDINLSDPTKAVLQEVERRKGRCFRDDNTESRDIVRAAAVIAAERGVKTLQFTDNSYIMCPRIIHLSNLSFLTTGRTWYESILPNLRCISLEEELLDHFRHLARTNTWRAVGHDLIKLNMTNSITGMAYDIDEPGSAMKVLNALKTDRRFCGFFAKNMDELLWRSHIYTLHGREWVCDLKITYTIPRFPFNTRGTRQRRSSTGRRRTTRKST
jgi:hypothetical protein